MKTWRSLDNLTCVVGIQLRYAYSHPRHESAVRVISQPDMRKVIDCVKRKRFL